jgi:toxin ParE1/3/4
MALDVLLTRDAERDLEEIYTYIVAQGELLAADRILDQLEDIVATLSDYPDRGSHPRELLDLGIREYRQILFDPYRLIYRVIAKQVIIYLIADGRRDMQGLLERRLL